MKPDFSYKFSQRIEQYITKNKMIGHGDFVLTGLSGGADSVCLFLLLNKLSEKLKFRVHAIHVNHNIRGESARRDEDFSRALCEKYNIPFKAYSIDVLKKAKDLKLSVEEAGRIARYECFNDYANILSENVALMHTLKGRADIKIAVAHHMNDQAETIIFNMLRGSGLKGVSGMKPVNGRVIRPLLCVTREEILKFLSENKQHYCTDETNSDNDYSRNNIRNEIIPSLIKLQPRTVEHIAYMADESGEAIKFIEDTVKKYFDEYCDKEINGYRINTKELKDENAFIVRELIIYVLKQMIVNYKDITRTHIEDIYGLFSKGKGKYVMLPYGITARKEKDSIIIEKS